MKNLKIKVGAKTDVGNVKQVNQDALLCKIGSIGKNEFGLFVVCDGLGGLEYVEIASKKTTQYFEEWWNTKLKTILRTKNNEKLIKDSLEKVLIKSNEELLQLSREINSKVGTTASALFILNSNYYIVHIGDSRIYEIKKKMTQLTEDHSQYEMLRKQGVKNLENVKKNVLTQCIGVNEKLDIFYKKGKVSKDTNFLICSDGLHNKMDEESVINTFNKKSKAIRTKDLQEICENLIDEVKEKKERDNITVLVINVREKNDKKRNLLMPVVCLLFLFNVVSGVLLDKKQDEITRLKNEISKENSEVENLRDTLEMLKKIQPEIIDDFINRYKNHRGEDCLSEEINALLGLYEKTDGLELSSNQDDEDELEKNHNDDSKSSTSDEGASDVDRLKLNNLIKEAQELLQNDAEGDKKNNYNIDSKYYLEEAINKAEEVYNNSSAKQDEIDLATSSLSSSISTFKNSKVTRSDRNPDGSYTREYVDAYVKRINPDFRLGVLDASEDRMHNGELCYLVLGSSIETNASGFTHSIEFYIGSKTLKEYPYSEVTGL